VSIWGGEHIGVEDAASQIPALYLSEMTKVATNLRAIDPAIANLPSLLSKVDLCTLQALLETVSLVSIGWQTSLLASKARLKPHCFCFLEKELRSHLRFIKAPE